MTAWHVLGTRPGKRSQGVHSSDNGCVPHACVGTHEPESRECVLMKSSVLRVPCSLRLSLRRSARRERREPQRDHMNSYTARSQEFLYTHTHSLEWPRPFRGWFGFLIKMYFKDQNISQGSSQVAKNKVFLKEK